MTTENRLLVTGFETVLRNMEEEGRKPADVFMILLGTDQSVHLHSACGVSREYVAAMIDVLEWVLSEMNNSKNPFIESRTRSPDA